MTEPGEVSQIVVAQADFKGRVQAPQEVFNQKLNELQQFKRRFADAGLADLARHVIIDSDGAFAEVLVHPQALERLGSDGARSAEQQLNDYYPLQWLSGQGSSRPLAPEQYTRPTGLERLRIRQGEITTESAVFDSSGYSTWSKPVPTTAEHFNKALQAKVDEGHKVLDLNSKIGVGAVAVPTPVFRR